MSAESDVIKAQKSNPDTDILTGIPFSRTEGGKITVEDVKAYVATLPDDQRTQFEGYMSAMTDEQIIAMFSQYIPKTSATYEGNLKLLGQVDLDSPKTISIYAKTFADKDEISALIEAYNKEAEESGHDELTIKYTDYVKLLMSSITTVIDVISAILIAFVAISLVVSSIMIGIITYISVLERTKEIGIVKARCLPRIQCGNLHCRKRIGNYRYRDHVAFDNSDQYNHSSLLRNAEHRRGIAARRFARSYCDQHNNDAYSRSPAVASCRKERPGHCTENRIIFLWDCCLTQQSHCLYCVYYALRSRISMNASLSSSRSIDIHPPDISS